MKNERNINNLINAGNTAQIEKLNENDHKEGFEELRVDECYVGAREELDEVYEEIIKPVIDYKKARREFADVANYAHMGILACDKMIEKENS